ncbi:MAG: hypothetical protein F6K55_06345 [Moorea sp. SIO4A3]|nr:hypothetical protein [Moorena sp. SIO4A3]
MGRWGDGESDQQLALQDSLGALSVGELNSPRVAPLHCYSLLPTPCSLLPAPCSLLPTPYSLLPAPCSLLPTPYSLLPTPYSLLPLSLLVIFHNYILHN